MQEIALRKLIDQEAILLLDVENYIGEQSREEIDYFTKILKKPAYYLADLKDPWLELFFFDRYTLTSLNYTYKSIIL